LIAGGLAQKKKAIGCL